MNESADRIYELLEQAKADCARERTLAVRAWDKDKAVCWQGCFDALATATDSIRPMVSEHALRSEESASESAALQVNRLSPIVETENLSSEPEHSGHKALDEGYNVTVARKSLIDAFGRMARFRKRPARREMMSISFRDGILTFSMLNVSERLPADGVWANDIMTNCSILFNLAKVPPIVDPVVIQVSDGDLHIGSAVTPVRLG